MCHDLRTTLIEGRERVFVQLSYQYMQRVQYIKMEVNCVLRLCCVRKLFLNFHGFRRSNCKIRALPWDPHKMGKRMNERGAHGRCISRVGGVVDDLVEPTMLQAVRRDLTQRWVDA